MKGYMRLEAGEPMVIELVPDNPDLPDDPSVGDAIQKAIAEAHETSLTRRIESLARRLAEIHNHDPDRLVLPPGLVPCRLMAGGLECIAADGSFTPVPLWHAYSELARELIRHDLVTEP